MPAAWRARLATIGRWTETIAAAASAAILLWVAIASFGEGKLLTLIVQVGVSLVFAIGLRWIYVQLRRSQPPRPVWSPWLVPVTLMVFWMATGNRD
jgi:hypothetical protein